jgi:hypothetical protein
MASTATVTAVITPQSFPSGTPQPGPKYRFTMQPQNGAVVTRVLETTTTDWTGLQPGVHTFTVVQLKADNTTPFGTPASQTADIPADVTVTIQTVSGITVQINMAT